MLNFLSRSARNTKSATNIGSASMSMSIPTPGTGLAVTVSAALALLGSILAERLAAQPLEIWADIACWAALLAITKFTTRNSRSSNHDRPQSGGWRLLLTLWFVAVCIVSLTIYRSELGIILLLPAITPFLLIAERILGSDTVDNDSTHRSLAFISTSVWGTIAIAFLCIGSLADWNFGNLTDINALAVVAASLLTLTQTIFLLPKNTQWARLLWIVFALVPVVPFIANIAAINGFYPAPPNNLNHHEHPVEVLMRNSQAHFHDMMQRQSMNVTAASNEYRRRYGIEPPPGFAEWFNFAHEMGAPIIDEYDMIHNSLAPLRVLSGKDIQNAMRIVSTLPDSHVWKCTYSAKTRQTTCTHPSRTFDRYVHDMFNAWLGGGDFGGGVPNTTVHLDVDVTFLVNHLDEPRVLLPGDAKPGDTNNKYSVNILDNKPVYDVITQHCTTQQQQQSSTNMTAEIGPTVDTFGIPFVTDRQAAIDLCRHPEYKNMHGMLTSPVSFPLIQGIVPIISCGALSSMGDILYPSPAYSEPEFMYDTAHDMPWDKKKNTVYWAGSTTGAYAQDTKSWRGFHRHRVVALAQNLEHSQHAYLTDEGGPPRRVFSSFLNGRLFDIAFTRVFQCGHRACRAMRSYFRQRPWAGRDDALQSRLVFGVDGNGISGRYYKLVASGSAPLKQTLLREWHDERLVPWVHYFPVSQGMEDVPELVSYLISKRGERAARTVAENGHRWFAQAMRPADRAVYVYRLLLELARLQDPNRPAGSASVPIGA
ncbi:hypothetical protein Sste5344_005562 [Sporothrix stenoceras]